MKRRVWKHGLYVVMSVLGLAVIVSVAFAFPNYMEPLPDKGANFGCGTCHVEPAGGDLNGFGVDFKEIGDNQYTDALAGQDSDGDGYTNAQEFAADPATNPGDPDSHPQPSAVNREGKNPSLWGKIKSE